MKEKKIQVWKHQRKMWGACNPTDRLRNIIIEMMKSVFLWKFELNWPRPQDVELQWGELEYFIHHNNKIGKKEFCDLKSEQMRSQFSPEQHSTLIETGVILRMMLSLMASLLMLRNRKHTAYLVNQPLKKWQTKCPFNLTTMIQMKL